MNSPAAFWTEDATAEDISAPISQFSRVLILNSARFVRDGLRNLVGGALMTATIAVASSLSEAATILRDFPVDLLITDIATSDGDVLDMLPQWTEHERRVSRVFIVSRYLGSNILEVLSALPIRAFFDDATEGPDALKCAVQNVASGGSYWSPSVAAKLVDGRPWERRWQELTLTERAVRATIGDGMDDKSAASALDLSVSTIRDVRDRLHRKLGVQQRAELMQVASSLGCVLFIDGRVIRPGYAMLISNYRKIARRRR